MVPLLNEMAMSSNLARDAQNTEKHWFFPSVLGIVFCVFVDNLLCLRSEKQDWLPVCILASLLPAIGKETLPSNSARADGGAGACQKRSVEVYCFTRKASGHA